MGVALRWQVQSGPATTVQDYRHSRSQGVLPLPLAEPLRDHRTARKGRLKGSSGIDRCRSGVEGRINGPTRNPVRTAPGLDQLGQGIEAMNDVLGTALCSRADKPTASLEHPDHTLPQTTAGPAASYAEQS